MCRFVCLLVPSRCLWIPPGVTQKPPSGLHLLNKNSQGSSTCNKPRHHGNHALCRCIRRYREGARFHFVMIISASLSKFTTATGFKLGKTVASTSEMIQI